MPIADLSGVRLNYKVAGAGHPVVFLHGQGLDGRLWTEQVAQVSRSYTTVCCDFRGHGKSHGSQEGYGLAGHVEDLRGLLAHLGLRRPSFVGHSMGGSVAIENGCSGIPCCKSRQ